MINSDINDKIEMSTLETGDILDDGDTWYATSLKTVTLPNQNGGFTNYPKGERVRIDREEAIKRFGEEQVTKLSTVLEKHKDKISLKEVVSDGAGRFYAK